MAFTLHKDTKPFLLGGLAGATLLAWVGFELVGWQAPGASARTAKGQATAAVAAALGKICTVQFNGAANLPERLVELRKVDQWSRSGLIAKAGFATMPGEKEPVNGVAEACASMLAPEKT